MKELFKRAARNASSVVWAVNLNHLLWGIFFLTQKLPLPFGGIHAFSDQSMQTFWGLTFIAVSLLSIASDFIRGIWGTILLIPQQLIVLYGAGGMLAEILAGDPSHRLLLAMCWVGPLALLHTMSVMTRYSREHHREFSEKIQELIDE